MAVEQPTDHPSMRLKASSAPPHPLRCPRCGHVNPVDEPRCLRCQTRLPRSETACARQGALGRRGTWPKVIPFEWIAPERVPPEVRRPPGRSSTLRVPRSEQPGLPLEAPAPLPRDVAPTRAIELPPVGPARRSAAVLLDGLLLTIGLGCFYLGTHLGPGPVPIEPATLRGWAGAMALVWLFYKGLFCLLDCESPGLKLAGLALVHYDGRAPKRWERFLRLGLGCLSVVGVGAGLLWALFDRDYLAWHDEASGTYLAEARLVPQEWCRLRRSPVHA